MAERREDDRDAVAGQPGTGTECGGEEPVERARGRMGRPETLEEDGHRGGAIGFERVGPPQVVECGIERGADGRLGGVPDATLEERALGPLHQRSAPRSRRRRAMMLR